MGIIVSFNLWGWEIVVNGEKEPLQKSSMPCAGAPSIPAR
jgi:hypothetical protein